MVLDTRNDMLAMSSEVSDGAVAYAIPPFRDTTSASTNEEIATSKVPETLFDINDDTQVTTTEDERQADATPVPEVELPDEESKLPELQPNNEQATVKPRAEEIQPDVTTVLSISSSTSDDSMLEDAEEMKIRVIPDMPITSGRNPNSIEEDDPMMTAVVVVSKKMHEIFAGKKSKFSM